VRCSGKQILLLVVVASQAIGCAPTHSPEPVAALAASSESISIIEAESKVPKVLSLEQCQRVRSNLVASNMAPIRNDQRRIHLADLLFSQGDMRATEVSYYRGSVIEYDGQYFRLEIDPFLPLVTDPYSE
jgi:hypothetical protein